MTSTLYSNDFNIYRNNLTLVVFSYRHLVNNLELDKPLLELLFQSRLFTLEDYNNFLKLVSDKPREVVARMFVDLLLTKMRSRGECFRDPKSKRRLEQGRSQIDYFETFMEVSFFGFVVDVIIKLELVVFIFRYCVNVALVLISFLPTWILKSLSIPSMSTNYSMNACELHSLFSG